MLPTLQAGRSLTLAYVHPLPSVMSIPTDRAQLWHALALCASDRAYELACPTIDGRQYYDPATRTDALRAAREFEAAALLWRPTDPASTRDCLIQAQAYANGAVLAD